ncbi:MAG: ribonuclease R [Succinivibrionaceae bacterium]
MDKKDTSKKQKTTHISSVLDDLMLNGNEEAMYLAKKKSTKKIKEDDNSPKKLKEKKSSIVKISSLNETDQVKIKESLFLCSQSKIIPIDVEIKSAEDFIFEDFLKSLNGKQYIKEVVSKTQRVLEKQTYELVKNIDSGSIISSFINEGKLKVAIIEDGILLIDPKYSEDIEGTIRIENHSDLDYKIEYFAKYLVDDTGNEYVLHTYRKTVFNKDVIKAIVNKKSEIAYYIKTVKENNLFLGRVVSLSDRSSVSCDDKNYQCFEYYFPNDEARKNATLGDIVICKITDRGENKRFAIEVEDVLGDFSKLDVQIQMAIFKNNIPHEWGEKLKKQLNNIPDEVLEKDKEGRVDIRNLPLVTIDGEDARDFDDAVYCEKLDHGYKLYVAIADVSYYVKVSSPLDSEAYKRGTSVYFPNYVVPMLPEKLSNGLCSLNPHVDRLCMVCEMEISNGGDILEYHFYPAVMNSHARFTYTEVASILAGNPASTEEFAARTKDLQNLYDLYKVLKRAKVARGAFEFDSEEVQIVFDENLEIADILPVVRNDAHKIIEECMVAANVCAAKFVEANKGETLFRVHDKPSAEKIKTFRSFIAHYGLTLEGGDEPEPKDYAELARKIDKNDPNANLLLTMMLRSLSLAVYTPENHGHFGLSLGHYAHFTSPIRRYPDLQLHREIKYLLGKNKTYKASIMKSFGANQYEYDELEIIGENCNMTERRADDVTRGVVSALKAKFMEKFIGKNFEGIISNVTNYGLFVSIERFRVDGMVHVSMLGGDFFIYDANSQMLVGESTGRTFVIGQRVIVKIESVEVDSGKIVLSLVQDKGKKKKIPIFDVSKYKGNNSIENSKVNAVIRESIDKVKLYKEKYNIDDSVEIIEKNELKEYKPSVKRKTESNNKIKNKTKSKN